MCFSAGASFGASAVLSLTGIATLRKATNPAQMMFAGIPLIFAIQQASEGCVWLSLSNPEYTLWLKPSTYIFLIFAQVVWPSWVPWAVLLLEKDEPRKKILSGLLGAGLLVSSYLAYRLTTQPIRASIVGMHIYYSLGSMNSILHYSAILYFVATVIPPFFSSVKKMWLFGSSIAMSYFITHFFFHDYELSVWCFFAAVISIAVFAILFELERNLLENRSPGELKTGLHI